jgi:hypothetical protein
MITLQSPPFKVFIKVGMSISISLVRFCHHKSTLFSFSVALVFTMKAHFALASSFLALQPAAGFLSGISLC